jgi:hypothetical protein
LSHAIKLSRGEINPPQFFDPAQANPPITLPSIRLHKKTVGGSFADWFIIKDDPSTPVADSRLATAIANLAIPRVNNFDAIRDPDGDPKKTLALKGQALTNVLSDMTEIDLSDTQLTSIAHLPTMLPNTITTLDLSQNQLTDLGGLEHFTKLLFFAAFVNNIQSVAPLTSLTALKSIGLGTNRIDDLTALRACVNLVSLDLGNNRVSDLTPLGALVNLESLHIEANRIVDLFPLKTLTKLRDLTIEEGTITIGDSSFPPNPIEVATGLDGLTRIANPFILADSVSVRFGRLDDGPAGQFTGSARRIERSNRFAVHLARQSEVKDDEWTWIFAAADDRNGVIEIQVQVKSDGVARSFVSPSDPTRAVAGDPQLTAFSRISGSLPSFDAQVSS